MPTTKKKLRILNPDVCEKCYLIECCCEADRLQVLEDDAQAKKKGFKPIKIKDETRWIKTLKA